MNERVERGTLRLENQKFWLWLHLQHFRTGENGVKSYNAIIDDTYIPYMPTNMEDMKQHS